MLRAATWWLRAALRAEEEALRANAAQRRARTYNVGR